MVEPTTFGFDEQTAVTNTFQRHSTDTSEQVTRLALNEFNQYVATLRAHDITVLTFRDTSATPKPNAVFPNNWFTTWPDGTVYLYPMATPSRRAERTSNALDLLRDTFTVHKVDDLSDTEGRGLFLEGTGVLVFDHAARVVYGCISPRCDQSLLLQHAQTLGYTPLAFQAFDHAGTAIYHTNVMLGVQTKTAVLYSSGITNSAEKIAVIQSLKKSGREIIDITAEQLAAFCGNILNVCNRHGEPFVVLSQTAFDAFTPNQRTVLAQSGTLLPVAIPTIEAIGGGSARCMLAEIFLAPK